MVKEEEELADSYEKGAAEGKVEGRAEGKVEGRAEGEVIGIEKIAINMLKEKGEHKFISTVTGLSKEEILKLQNKI
jgi:predicted transposase YdaD